MAKLDDLRRRFPPEDPDAYAAAYAEAVLAEHLAALVHGLRTSAGLDPDDLAARMGVDEEEIARAEEGDASVTAGFLDRLGRAVGVSLTVTGGTVDVVLGASAPAGSPEV